MKWQHFVSYLMKGTPTFTAAVNFNSLHPTLVKQQQSQTVAHSLANSANPVNKHHTTVPLNMANYSVIVITITKTLPREKLLHSMR